MTTTSFQVGDRVKYVRNTEGLYCKAADIGRVGTVVAPEGSKSVDVTFDDDGMPKTRNVFKANLNKIAKFKVGETVEISAVTPGVNKGFLGLRATVVSAGASDAYILPHADRPDGYKRTKFYWPASNLKKVVIAQPTFNVGDKVELTYKSRLWDGAGTVTATGKLCGRPAISLKMTTGRMAGSIGAFYLDDPSTSVTPVDKKAEALAELKATVAELQKLSDKLFNLDLKISALADALS